MKHVPISIFQRNGLSKQEIATIVLFSFVFLSGTCGNAFVIKSFATGRQSERAGSRFVIILAAVDIVASIWVPFYTITRVLFYFSPIYHWPHGKLSCTIIRPLYRSTFYASAWLLVAISLERTR